MRLHNKVIHGIRKYHRIRKAKEENLPPWKEKWHGFNRKYLHWLESLVDKLIPWLVFLLLLMILGEFSEYLNFFHWHWVDFVSEFFHEHEAIINIVDQVIITFFVIDLYFNFFRKATFVSFLKTSILDIIAVAPLGLIFRVSEISEAQSILHVTEDIEKEVSRVLKEGESASKLIKAEQEAARLARLQKLQKASRTVSRIPRFLRMYRLTDFFRHKKKDMASEASVKSGSKRAGKSSVKKI